MDCLIPLLRIFFENFKYLEPYCIILKHLIGNKMKGIICRSLKAYYYCPKNLTVPFLETSQWCCSKRGFVEDRWLCYAQLWAFCLRNFPYMTQFAPRKEIGKEKPTVREPSPALYQNLGHLAVTLGFRTPTALALESQDPERELAIQLLQKANPRLKSTNERKVTAIASVLKQSEDQDNSIRLPQFTSSKPLPADRRCGRPFDDDYRKDDDCLFIPYIYGSKVRPGANITPFFVKRDFFITFFGFKSFEVYLTSFLYMNLTN